MTISTLPALKAIRAVPEMGARKQSLFDTFRLFPGKSADSGGPSLPSGSERPGITGIPGSGQTPESDGKGPESGCSGFRQLSDYCVAGIHKYPGKVTFPGSSISAKTEETLSVLFGVGSGNPGIRRPGSRKVKGRPRIRGTGVKRGVPARPLDPGQPGSRVPRFLSNTYPGSPGGDPGDRARSTEVTVTMLLK